MKGFWGSTPNELKNQVKEKVQLEAEQCDTNRP